MIDDQNFEKAIRTKLVQHESDVPDAMWSGIDRGFVEYYS